MVPARVYRTALCSRERWTAPARTKPGTMEPRTRTTGTMGTMGPPYFLTMRRKRALTTPAATLVKSLRARGVQLRAVGDRIRYRPASALTTDDLEALRQQKAEVLPLLATAQPSSPAPTLTLDPIAVREVLGPHYDEHDLGILRLDVLAMVRQLEIEIENGVIDKRVRTVLGRLLCDWLDPDEVARLLRLGGRRCPPTRRARHYRRRLCPRIAIGSHRGSGPARSAWPRSLRATPGRAAPSAASEKARELRHIFLAAEAEVGAVIRDAVVRAAGDPWRALDLVREWRKVSEERQDRTIQAVRFRAASIPLIDELIDHAREISGDDEDAVNLLVDAYLKSPDVRARVEEQLAEVASAALVAWVQIECSAWVAGRLG